MRIRSEPNPGNLTVFVFSTLWQGSLRGGGPRRKPCRTDWSVVSLPTGLVCKRKSFFRMNLNAILLESLF